MFRILSKAAFDSGERKRLYKEAQDFLTLRAYAQQAGEAECSQERGEASHGSPG